MAYEAKHGTEDVHTFIKKPPPLQSGVIQVSADSKFSKLVIFLKKQLKTETLVSAPSIPFVESQACIFGVNRNVKKGWL
jgi:hypothetical protein